MCVIPTGHCYPFTNFFLTKYHSCTGVTSLECLKRWLLMLRSMSPFFLIQIVYLLGHQGRDTTYKRVTNNVFLATVTV
jgi:hypothetical protein